MVLVASITNKKKRKEKKIQKRREREVPLNHITPNYELDGFPPGGWVWPMWGTQCWIATACGKTSHKSVKLVV